MKAEGLARQLRLRDLPSPRADHGRRGARRAAPALAVLSAHVTRRRAASGPTWRRQSSCGRSTTRCPSTCAPAVLLGAFVGLRTSEAAALRVTDVDFMRGVVSPAIQYPADPLKSETSRTPVPIPQELALELAAAVQRSGWPDRRHGRDRPADVAVGDRAGRPVGTEACRRAAGGLPVPRPAALLRLAPDRERRRREGRPEAHAARERDDDAQHLRAHVARLRRDHPRRRC